MDALAPSRIVPQAVATGALTPSEGEQLRTPPRLHGRDERAERGRRVRDAEVAERAERNEDDEQILDD
jgi:hypothetical protein